MKTWTQRSLSTDAFAQIVTEIYMADVEDLSKNESVFRLVMQNVMVEISKAITVELLPRVSEILISKIDLESIVQEAARKRVTEALFK